MVLLTGFAQADAIASLVVVVLMVEGRPRAWCAASGRIFLEAAPAGVDPAELAPQPGRPAGRGRGPRPARLADHLGRAGAVGARAGRPRARTATASASDLETLLAAGYTITHTTLQVDHAGSDVFTLTPAERHCADPHGETHRNNE